MIFDFSEEIIMNSTEVFNAWYEANNYYLLAALDCLSGILKIYSASLESDSSVDDSYPNESQSFLKDIDVEMPAPSALSQVCLRFNLSEFETSILLLCIGVELDSVFSDLCAEVHSVDNQRYPTFGLALRALPNPHWSGFAPDGALRHWNLIKFGSGSILTETPLYIDERILHYLVGVQTTDPLLTELVELPPNTHHLIPSYQNLADKIEVLWQLSSSQELSPIVQLCGSEIEDKIDIAQAVCQNFERGVSLLNGDRIPLHPKDLASFTRRLERECILEHRALLLNCDDMDLSDPEQRSALNQLIEEFTGFIIVTTRAPLQALKRQTRTPRTVHHLAILRR
jgi:hypothetical protein